MIVRRVSVRKWFVYLVAVAGVVLVVVNGRLWEWSSGADASQQALQLQQPQQSASGAALNATAAVAAAPPPPPPPPAAAAATAAAAALQHPWFMKGGRRLPTVTLRNRKTRQRMARLFPEEAAPGADRIVNQLMYVPPDYNNRTARVRTILLYNGLSIWGTTAGDAVFRQCPVNTCALAADRALAARADAILYKDNFLHPGTPRPPNQVWILYFLECPYHTPTMKYPQVFNWTATYRRDSDIVAPYERWAYYDERVKQLPQPERNFAANKTKKVAWFVSNCGARNGRLQYARELQKYIQVDIYGACGPFSCSRVDYKRCFELLNRDYKFYLAFENSNCKDYITEKFFVNGLGRDILPIVMGARPEDYERSAPYRSYIHVDEFQSPRELADYLHRLDADDELYNSYFRWKGTGEFINTFFWCRLCAMLHGNEHVHKTYADINDWWRGDRTCSIGSWRKGGDASAGVK